jgi:hypothetical protein
VLPEPRAPDGLLLGVAAIDHSGRFGDRLLITELGWQPGDQIDVEVLPGAAVLRRSPHGRFQVDSRGHVFLSTAIRTVLGVPVGGRVVLLAVPERNLLMIHPPQVVGALLAGRYPRITGAPDDR